MCVCYFNKNSETENLKEFTNVTLIFKFELLDGFWIENCKDLMFEV